MQSASVCQCERPARLCQALSASCGSGSLIPAPQLRRHVQRISGCLHRHDAVMSRKAVVTAMASCQAPAEHYEAPRCIYLMLSGVVALALSKLPHRCVEEVTGLMLVHLKKSIDGHIAVGSGQSTCWAS